MSFCGECGTKSTGGAFCSNCGTALAGGSAKKAANVETPFETRVEILSEFFIYFNKSDDEQDQKFVQSLYGPLYIAFAASVDWVDLRPDVQNILNNTYRSVLKYFGVEDNNYEFLEEIATAGGFDLPELDND